MQHRDEGVLIVADVVDGDGELFPRKVLEDALDGYLRMQLQAGYITEQYGRTPKDIDRPPDGG
jgi:hypothetical protein